MYKSTHIFSIVSSLTLVVGVVFFLNIPHVYAESPLTKIRGNVYNESTGGKGITGLIVTVTCASTKKKSVTKTALTDTHGLYTITFNEAVCEQHRPVTAKVTFKGATQTQTVYVSEQHTATLDFYFGKVRVPEFGFIPGLIAVVSSASSFFVLRKRI